MQDGSPSFVEWLFTDTGRAAIAGAAGGLVRWVVTKDDPKQAAGTIVVGCVCALYLGPIANPIFAPVIGYISPEGDSSGFSAFVIGMGGMTVAQIIMDIWTRFRSAKNK